MLTFAKKMRLASSRSFEFPSINPPSHPRLLAVIEPCVRQSERRQPDGVLRHEDGLAHRERHDRADTVGMPLRR
jgi:hypothetical protein